MGGSAFDTLYSPRLALTEIANPSITNLLATVKGLKKKDKVMGGKRKKGWVQMQGKKKSKQCNKENESQKQRENVPIQETGQKVYDMGTSQSSLWKNYEYGT
ncbi:hypothetical protein CFOL_v3_13699, partial [Cephalotus follicularis]